jgi:hypothetical protein
LRTTHYIYWMIPDAFQRFADNIEGELAACCRR